LILADGNALWFEKDETETASKGARAIVGMPTVMRCRQNEAGLLEL